MSAPEKIVRVWVTGRVQGVGFRAFTQKQAEAHGVSGWVRNRRNGEVEAVFAGSKHAVTSLCEACREGPSDAQVERVEIFEADHLALVEVGGLPGFRQIATQ